MVITIQGNSQAVIVDRRLSKSKGDQIKKQKFIDLLEEVRQAKAQRLDGSWTVTVKARPGNGVFRQKQAMIRPTEWLLTKQFSAVSPARSHNLARKNYERSKLGDLFL